MPVLPQGTVTFLLTDVEGSTALAERLRSAYQPVLADHQRLLRDAVSVAGGVEVDARSEELFAAFATARTAVEAALAAQRAHARHAWPQGSEVRVRMAIHTGEPTVADTGYLGLDVHRAARICALAHGGQILLSQTTRDLLAKEEVLDLGEHELKGLSGAEHVYQLLAPDLPREFPPPRAATSPAAIAQGREHELASAARRAVRSPVLADVVARLRRRTGVPGLAELGWEVRRALPNADGEAREQLAGLAGDLFSAGRSATHAEVLLAEVDGRRLRRAEAEHRELGVLSRRAAAEAESLHRRVEDLDELAKRRAALDALALAVQQALPAPPDVPLLRGQLRAATAELDIVRERLAPVRTIAARLRRTPWPGIYRRRHAYVVPFFDGTGVEHHRPFERLEDARAFRRVLRLEKQIVGTYGEPPGKGNDLAGGGGA